ncbi:LuxR C-terminal-related transcriptional regulator [Benzoatithermus flavus]|uniref:Response regulator transcription factor n=1 Tax=Benzoatithermus flavus TaxID=3108223 RepID=A0ABU8XM49_9PROT
MLVLYLAQRSAMRAGLVRALEECAPELRVLPLPNLGALASVARGVEPTLVLLDVGAGRLHDSPVAWMITSTRAQLPDVPVAILVDHEIVTDILAAFESGIRGYVPARLAPHLVAGALRLVLMGGTFVPAEPLLASLAHDDAPVRRLALSALPDEGRTADPADPALAGLSRRQLAVVDLLCRGKSNRAIADELGLPMSTVKVYARQIMRRLGAINRTQVAMKLAARRPSTDL